MSPPPSRYDHENSQFPHPDAFMFQGPARPSPQSTRPPAFVAEKMPQLPSEEDLAKMSARSDGAMAVIDWLSKPFIGTGADLSDILPIDPSPAPVKDLELGFMYTAQSKNAVPNPAHAQRFQNEAEHNPPNVPVQQGTKRKEHDEGNEDFQRVQLDERQVTLQGSKTRSNQEASKPNATYSSHRQWQRLADRFREYQSPYSQE